MSVDDVAAVMVEALMRPPQRGGRVFQVCVCVVVGVCICVHARVTVCVCARATVCDGGTCIAGADQNTHTYPAPPSNLALTPHQVRYTGAGKPPADWGPQFNSLTETEEGQS